jgi:hypothetical protein
LELEIIVVLETSNKIRQLQTETVLSLLEVETELGRIGLELGLNLELPTLAELRDPDKLEKIPLLSYLDQMFVSETREFSN